MHNSLSRRRFMGAAAGAASLSGTRLAIGAQPGPRRRRLAIIATVWRYQSHAQHMGDRFLVGYPHQGRWHQPDIDVVSLYVDQQPEGDQSLARAEEFGFRVFPSVAEALRVGERGLGVDAVLLIGEHGDYPRNAIGQKLYPRFELFEQIVDVFRSEGRAVPVFNDKHLSTSFDKAMRMVEAARTLNFPLMAGSSLPVTWRLPSVELPLGTAIQSALMVGYGGTDSYDFHGLEAMQCMLERRAGGETGVRSVQMLVGDDVWAAGDEGRWKWELLEAALSRSNQLQGVSRSEAKPQNLLRNGALRSLADQPAAYLVEYNDGLRATLLMLNGAVEDFTFAAQLADPPRTVSTLFYLPPQPNVEYSAELMNRVEQMFMTGEATTPVQRTLLVSGVLESCLTSRAQGGQRLSTPQLDVRYTAAANSQFARS